MDNILKQNTAVTIVMGVMVDSTDGNTPETGLSIAQADIRLSKNGGAYAQSNNAAGATHMETGKYSVPLNVTDTATLGKLRVDIHVTGALAVWREFVVVPANAYDTLVLGTDVLTADITQMGGVAQSATDLKNFADYGYNTSKAVVNSDLQSISGDITSALDLKDFADEGYEKTTHKIIGTTDMRGTDSAALATALSTHDGKLDTVDTNVDTILVDTNELQTDWKNGGRLDLLIDRLIAANEVESTTATGATSSTVFAATGLLDDTDNHYNDGVMIFTSGANRGQPKRILDFTGATKEITVSSAFETTPSIGDSFVITTQLAAAASAGGDATATNQLAIIAALTAIKGTGWVQTSHSLAERPTGAGGGGGHCAWYDDDLARATQFFKTFPTDFQKFVNDSTKVSTDTSRKQIDSELNHKTKLSQILSHMTAMQTIVDSMQSTIDSIQSAQKTTDAVILEIANETALEAALDGFEED